MGGRRKKDAKIEKEMGGERVGEEEEEKRKRKN